MKRPAPARRPLPPPAPPAGSGPDPSEIADLARSVWLHEGARPGLEDRCREEVACQLWLTHYPGPPESNAP